MDSFGQQSAPDQPQADVQTQPQAETPQAQTPPTDNFGHPISPAQQPDAEQVSPPQEQWFVESTSGTKYRTADEAARGIAEKDRLIAELLGRQPAQPQAAPVPQPTVDPTAEFNDLANKIEMRYVANPKYAGYSREDIRAQAEIDADNQLMVMQTFQDTLRQQQARDNEEKMRAEGEAFMRQNPILTSDVGQQVFDKYAAMGMTARSPQEHLTQMRAEGINIGQQAPQSQQPQPAYNGVNGAVQRQQASGQIFQNAQYSSQPAMPEALPKHVQDSIDYARTKSGTTEADIQRIITLGKATDVNSILIQG